jgi:reductive dehalogenase
MTLTLSQIILILLAGTSLFLFGSFTIASLKEKEVRAASIASLFTILVTLLFLIPVFLNPTLQYWALGITALILILFTIAFLLPIGRVDHQLENTQTRPDERRVIFSRSNLIPDSERLKDYYLDHPEDQVKDDPWRANAGLLSPQSDFFEPLSFAAAAASFATLDALAQAANGPVAAEPTVIKSGQASQVIKSLAKFFGAMDAGICELNPAYVYTHSGRGSEPYGSPVPISHKYAIAMTFEMDHDMIAANPRPPGVMETGHRYVESARTAVQLAATIRNLGFPAVAHFEGHYQVIAPPIARDAGLGEIGRMSLLITPRKGPRVRLAVVTTDFPLMSDKPTLDSSVTDFCTICKKCSQNCPATAIPFDAGKESDGAKRWRINPEACFGYWTQTGTDCGRCMCVCPYSHPDQFPHGLIRWGIRHSGFFRRAALNMDDIFYGKYPKPRPAPAWTTLSHKEH